MKILVVCIHYPVCSGRYYVDAFERLGHDVRHIGETTHDNIWGMKVDSKYIWRSHGGYAKSWHDWTPDVIVITESAFQYHHPYYSDVKHIIIAVDNHVRNYVQPGINHYFLAHYHGQEQPVTAEPNSTWLPCAYDPQWFTPSPISWLDRPFDVAIIGVMYPERLRIIDAMEKAGLKVFAATGLVYREYRDAYWQSKVALCSSARSDLAQRIFECGAMGCTVLTDRLLDLEHQHTNKLLGLRGWAGYSNVDEAVGQALELVQLDPDKGEYGAWLMMNSCKRHTWDSRAQIVIDYLEGRPHGLKPPLPAYVSQTGLVKIKENTGMVMG